MANVFPMIRFAFSASPFPLSMEKSGEPPIPNKFAKAVMMVRMGKVMPTPVRASAPTPGICPRYIRSTTL